MARKPEKQPKELLSLIDHSDKSRLKEKSKFLCLRVEVAVIHLVMLAQEELDHAAVHLVEKKAHTSQGVLSRRPSKIEYARRPLLVVV